MRQDQYFCDVTLATDNDNQMKAHKVILSAVSGFFLEVLKTTEHHPNPYIFLKGVRREFLDSFLDFVYRWEANIKQSDVENFLQTAKELRIFGISEEAEETSPESDKTVQSVPHNIIEEAADTVDVKIEHTILDNKNIEVKPINTKWHKHLQGIPIENVN